MRVLLVSPSESKYVNFSKSKKTISAALLLLAAYTPREYEVMIADQNYGDNAYQDNIDLVGISAMTPQALQGYKIARYYRERGVQVVMGGIHASAKPEEVQQHVDTVCVGEADGLWKQILDDASAGRLKKLYKSESLFPMEDIPPFRHDLVKRKRMTFHHAIIQASRGCPYNCEFCITSGMFGNRYRCRPTDSVVEEVERCGSKRIFFVDDNIFGSPAYCEELFKKLMPLKIKWVGQASLNSITRDLDLMRLAKKSGAIGFFVGVESVNHLSRQSSNSSAKLGSSDLRDISQKIRLMLDNGLMIQTSIVFGLDGDDAMVFEKTVDFLIVNGVTLSSFCMLTPYPGTRIYIRFKEEKRLIHEDWSKYSNENVVFYPKLMTPEQLKNGSDWAGTNFYNRRSIARRFLSNWYAPVLYLGMNMFTRQANLTNHAPGSIVAMKNKEKRNWCDTCANARMS